MAPPNPSNKPGDAPAKAAAPAAEGMSSSTGDALERLRERVERAASEIQRLREENARLAERVAGLAKEDALQEADTQFKLQFDSEPEELRERVQGFIDALDRVLAERSAAPLSADPE